MYCHMINKATTFEQFCCLYQKHNNMEISYFCLREVNIFISHNEPTYYRINLDH